MEGPSLLLASQQLIVFKGKKVKIVSGNTKIGKEKLLGKTIIDIFSWGKHLVFQFDSFALRVHFMLFGTYEAAINDVVVTGDYQRSREPRLEMDFVNGNIKLFNCSLKVFETSDLKTTYDFSVSIISDKFDKEKAVGRIKKIGSETIDDVLLDQEIFAGVGNIIKNEVLFLTKTNPHTKVEQLSLKKLREIIHVTEEFSFQFYEWKKKFVLRKNLQIYKKKTCPQSGDPSIREKTGKRQRLSYYCPVCQPLKSGSTT